MPPHYPADEADRLCLRIGKRVFSFSVYERFAAFLQRAIKLLEGNVWGDLHKILLIDEIRFLPFCRQ
ncbi:MAG: hypothetical protein CL608_34130 [Anaerolineaceae bacterium]|nr:hypothetical protein [Anaerolineaceae bacterium]